MTETTTPDPQVVAWMRGYLADNPAPDGYGTGNKATTIGEGTTALWDHLAATLPTVTHEESP